MIHIWIKVWSLYLIWEFSWDKIPNIYPEDESEIVEVFNVLIFLMGYVFNIHLILQTLGNRKLLID